jgi:hypothetical protein
MSTFWITYYYLPPLVYVDIECPQDDREWQNFCGATLITNQYAMSAYHCFTKIIGNHLKLLSADYSRKERLGNDIIEWITVVAGRYQSHPLGSSAAKPGIWGKEANEQVNAMYMDFWGIQF